MKDFNIDDSLGFIVAKTNYFMKTYFSKLIKDNGLNVTTEQWAILNAVYHNPGASQTDLARACLKDKTNVTRILDLLVKKGYVVRNIDINDRRIYSITLTEQGENALELLIDISNNANKACISDLNKDEYQELVRSLRIISSSIEKLL
ncbi:MarR family transcriptional regulator [Desulfosporosinus sp.]|uniref:MarR family winged helix-turn-helix transcriptional regulator n=1 Tax=Desulfosporosinus sp. TaxID=157907 RepID=UPI00230C2C7C|nr:MarR family transcriptional regulator [Desulfosporosinus sp.]MCO5388739.1 MarR family transcriptional regulator [Desulfosporosinus sp.]MDA8224170.1 MarR family transcriptional regulator [Desulfitobacterium hafniense]